MKKMLLRLIIGIAAFLVGVLVNPAIAQQSPKPAIEILKEASLQASTENKKVFIIFQASWCGWCHRMDSIMNSPTCKELFSDNYVVRHLVVLEPPAKKNLENPGAMDLLKKYNANKHGIPFWLIFDIAGNLLADSQVRPDGAGFDTPGENTGCPATQKEVNFFVGILKRTSRLNNDQLAVIGRSFIKK